VSIIRLTQPAEVAVVGGAPPVADGGRLQEQEDPACDTKQDCDRDQGDSVVRP